jgi:hypothetical protein
MRTLAHRRYPTLSLLSAPMPALYQSPLHFCRPLSISSLPPPELWALTMFVQTFFRLMVLVVLCFFPLATWCTDALSLLRQVLSTIRQLQDLGACNSNCWIWPSITQASPASASCGSCLWDLRRDLSHGESKQVRSLKGG